MTTGTLRREYIGNVCVCCDLDGPCAVHQDGQLVYIAALERSNVYTFTSTSAWICKPISLIIHRSYITAGRRKLDLRPQRQRQPPETFLKQNATRRTIHRLILHFLLSHRPKHLIIYLIEAIAIITPSFATKARCMLLSSISASTASSPPNQTHEIVNLASSSLAQSSLRVPKLHRFNASNH